MPLNEDSAVLSGFRSMPYRPKFSRARSSGGLPLSSKELSRRFLAKFAARAASPVSAISENWKKCVPAKFAAKSSPVNVRAGVLYVAADNPQIRQELQFAARGMLKKIRGFEGCSSIKSIRFI